MGHVQKTAEELQVHTYLVTKNHCIVDPHSWCYAVQRIVLEQPNPSGIKDLNGKSTL